ncbi:MAG: DNA methyltransferase [Candidatus Aminicenantales bacterium]
MDENTLYYGDNLDILQRYIKDDSIDLVYLDPPFKSDQSYNILYKEQNGARAASQIRAFEDTWTWNQEGEETYAELITKGGKVADCVQAFRKFLGPCDMLAYLVMMTPRLVELRRVMKPTASIYFHCDPVASHYLKMLMDAVFGPEHFRNEIIWRRTGSHNKLLRYGPIHDVILFYTRTGNFTWNYPKRPYMKGHVEENFVKDDSGYKTAYYGNVLTGAGLRGGESGKTWRGIDPSAKNRHWALPGALLDDIDEDMSGLSQHQKLDRLFELGFIKIDPGQAWPMYERRLKKDDGQLLSDIWAFQPYTNGTVFGTEEGIDEDARWLSTRDRERLGYQTQKPEGLLGRIIKASSNKDDIVLDPFCGCGTTIAASQKLQRKWIGIDITHLAITLMKTRLKDAFGDQAKYQVIGEPVSVPDAAALAESDPYQFQYWALGLVGARPVERKKGADKGIDGKIIFQGEKPGEFETVIISVKGGNLKATDIRDLRGVVEREKAAIGALISMDEPTKPMQTEAVTAGFYEHRAWGTKHPKLQLLTVAEILAVKAIDMPPVRQLGATFKKAEKFKKPKKEQMVLKGT